MANYELGPCQILYTDVDGSSGGLVDLGKTFGGVKVTIEESSQQLKTDQSGETPEDDMITGTVVKVSAALADISLENMAFMLKGSVETETTKKKVVIVPNAGTSLMTNAKKLVIKPYVSGIPTTDANKWITLFKAGIRAQLDLTYDASTQRVIKFEATGYPDDNTEIGCFGDDTIA